MIVPFQERRATFPRWMTSETDEQLLQHIKEMTRLSKHKPAGYEVAIKGHLFLMLFQAASSGRLVNRSRSEADMVRTERLKKVILYIQNHYHRPIRLSELADLIPMSEGQFCRFFKSMTGQTPVDYMNSYRVRQVAELLRQRANIRHRTRCRIRHISYFVRVFRKIMDCAFEYRKNYNFGRLGMG